MNKKRIKATFREFALVFGQFKRTILALLILCIIGTLGFIMEEDMSISKAFYSTGGIITGNPPPYHESPIIQFIGIIFPILGLLILGEGFLRFGMKVFEKQHRAKEWNFALAKTMNKQTILTGFSPVGDNLAVGHVATRVLEELLRFENQDVVVIVPDEETLNDLSNKYKGENVAFIVGNPSSRTILEQAGVGKARAIIACEREDLYNLKIAIEAKELNPKIRTICRIYDAEFAKKVCSSFAIDLAISTSQIAAPAFVAGSMMDGIIQTITTGKRRDHIAQMHVASTFETKQVGDIEDQFDVTLISIERPSKPEESEIHLEEDDVIQPGDNILVLGRLAELKKIRKYLGIKKEVI